MDDHASRTRRGAVCFLIGPLTALCLVVPVLAGPSEGLDEKSDAAKAKTAALKAKKHA